MKSKLTKLITAIAIGAGMNAFAQGEFITRWNMATTGSGPTQLTFPVGTSGVVSYSWTTIPAGSVGTGTFTGSTALIHSLPAGATVQLAISPVNFNSISLNVTSGDKRRIVDIEQWGTTAWTTMKKAFPSCTNLQISATDVPNLSGVTDMSEMFAGCVVMNSPNLVSWNTSSVNNMSFIFSSAYAFNQNISSWNTANVTNMAAMFVNARAFDQNIGGWNTANVTNMDNMFEGTYVFNQNIGGWNTANLQTAYNMFNGARAFNQNIDTWNTSSLTATAAMFYGAIAFNQGLPSWNVSGITNMYNMFSGATAFDQSLAAWAPGLNANVNLGNFLNNSGLSVANYDATLIAFNNQGPVGRTMDAIGLKYCAAASARANLTSVKGWTITGDAPSGTAAVPAFASVSPVCSGSNMPALPVVSTNSVSGSWLPALNNTVSTTYTFTPGAGQCASSTTLGISVMPRVAPAFAPVSAVCSGSSLSALPVVSTNSITGSWLPALNNTVSTTYSFTPNAGECASSTTLGISVTPRVVPAFAPVSAVCFGSTMPALPAVSTNSITGSWLPAVNNTVTTTYSFMPNAGECAQSTTLSVVVTPSVTPAFMPINSICVGTNFTHLPLSATNGVSGTWMPAIVYAPATYTFVPDAGQCAINTVTMSVTANLPPAATTTLSGAGITATESGATYQWIDCGNGNAIIPNAIQQTYAPTRNGSYAVIVVKNGCRNTSACQNVTSVGLQAWEAPATSLLIAPNPNQGSFRITGLIGTSAEVSIYNAMGQLLYSQPVQSSEETIHTGVLPAGVYSVAVTANGNTTIQKMLIEP